MDSPPVQEKDPTEQLRALFEKHTQGDRCADGAPAAREVPLAPPAPPPPPPLPPLARPRRPPSVSASVRSTATIATQDTRVSAREQGPTARFVAPAHVDRPDLHADARDPLVSGREKLLRNTQHTSMFFAYYTRVCKELNVDPTDTRGSVSKFMLAHAKEPRDIAPYIAQLSAAGSDTPTDAYVDADGLTALRECLRRDQNYTTACASLTIWKVLHSFVAFLPHELMTGRTAPYVTNNRILQRTKAILQQCGVPQLTYDVCCRTNLLCNVARIKGLLAARLVFQTFLYTHAESSEERATHGTRFITHLADERYTDAEYGSNTMALVRDCMYIDVEGFSKALLAYTNERAVRAMVTSQINDLCEFNVDTTEPKCVDTTSQLYTNKRLGLQALAVAKSRNIGAYSAQNDDVHTSGAMRTVHAWKHANKISPLLSAFNTKLAYFVQTQTQILDRRERETILRLSIHSPSTILAIINGKAVDHGEADVDVVLFVITQLTWRKEPFQELKRFIKQMSNYIPHKHTAYLTVTDWLHAYVAAYQCTDAVSPTSVTAYCTQHICDFYSNTLATQITQFRDTNELNRAAYMHALTDFARTAQYAT